MGGSLTNGPLPGGPGSGSGGSGGAKRRDECNLSFDTDVFGPVPSVAKKVSVDDELHIQLVQQGGHSSVGVLLPSGEQLGSIAGSNYLPALVRCLQNGVNYTAKVIAINGAQIIIRISRQ